MSSRAVCRRPLVRIAMPLLAAVAVTQLASRSARASANVGVEAGIVARNTSASPELSPGFGVGSRIEVGPAPFITFGVYFLQSINNFRADSSTDVVFNTLGARTRLVLPLGDIKPYVWAGVAPTWSRYRFPNGGRITGQFWETPIGLGVGYRVLELFQIAVEGAYRPSSGFSGTAYDAAGLPSPTSGWSAVLVLALDA